MDNAKFTILSDVEPKPVQWLWRDRIPLGELTLFDADSATNKSSITLDLAARVSTGRSLPDGSEGLVGGVILLQTEDSLEKTVVPRLDAAGADRSRIAILSATVMIPKDLPDIEAAIIAMDAKLLVIDPLSEFLGRNANSEQSVRQALAPLAALAERQGIAGILVRHLNKSVGQGAMYRGLGSVGIVAAARSRFILGPHPKDPNVRVLAHAKTNLGLLTPSLLYEPVTGENGAVRIEWRGECGLWAEEVLAPQKRGLREIDAAKHFLTGILSRGPMAQKDIKAEATKRGVAWRTVERAKADLGIVSERRGFGQGSVVYWSLPPDEQHTPPTKDVAVNDNEAHTTPLSEVAVNECAEPEHHTPPTKDVAVNDEAHIPPIDNHGANQHPEPEQHTSPTDLAAVNGGHLDRDESEPNAQPTTKPIVSRPDTDPRELVLDALKQGPLTLLQSAQAVLKGGYRTPTQNLSQFIYNTLTALRKDGEVSKDDTTKRYSIATPEERQAALNKRAADERKRRDELAARAEHLVHIRKALMTVSDNLLSLYCGLDAKEGLDLAKHLPAATTLYARVEAVAEYLHLKQRERVPSTDGVQACRPESFGRLLAETTLIVDAVLDSANLTTGQKKKVLQEGQDMFDIAYVFAIKCNVDFLAM